MGSGVERREMERELKEKALYATELEGRIKQLVAQLSTSDSETEKLKVEKGRLEARLHKQREESSIQYKKVQDEVGEKERQNMTAKLEKAKEEGFLAAQKQQRAYREEELKKLTDAFRAAKLEAEQLRDTAALLLSTFVFQPLNIALLGFYQF